MVSTMVSKTTSLSSNLSTPAIYLIFGGYYLLEVFMYSSFFMFSRRIFIFFTVFILFICFFFIPVFSSSDFIINSEYILDENISYTLNNSSFLWPTPGYTKITSYFGKRNAPTSRFFYLPFWNRYWSTNRC